MSLRTETKPASNSLVKSHVHAIESLQTVSSVLGRNRQLRSSARPDGFCSIRHIHCASGSTKRRKFRRRNGHYDEKAKPTCDRAECERGYQTKKRCGETSNQIKKGERQTPLGFLNRSRPDKQKPRSNIPRLLLNVGGDRHGLRSPPRPIQSCHKQPALSR
jgi:hypothetical protein